MVRTKLAWLLLVAVVLFGVQGCASLKGDVLLEFDYFTSGDPSLHSRVVLRERALMVGRKSIPFDEPIGDNLAGKIAATMDEVENCQSRYRFSEGGGHIIIVVSDGSECSIAEIDFQKLLSNELNALCSRNELHQTIRGFNLCRPVRR
jgi:hypothetical protein